MAGTSKTKRNKSGDPPAAERTGDGDTPEENASRMLSGLEIGTKIMVRRYHPSYAKGFCTTLDVPDGGGDEVIPLIQADFGGGTYSLQEQQRGADGRYHFAGKGVLVDIAGEPTHFGRKYAVGGKLEPEQNPALMPVQAAAPVVVHAPAPRDNGLQSQLLSMFGEMVKGGSAGGTDMSRLFEVLLTNQQQAPARSDSFGDLERVLGLVTKMTAMMGDRAAPAAASDDEGGFLGGGATGGMIEKLLLAKFMGGDQQQQPAQPQANPTMGPQPTPAHVWSPQLGWVHPGQLRRPPQAGQPVAPQPSPTPPPAAPQPAAPQPTPPPAAEADTGGDDDEQAPLTAAEMTDEFQSMTDEERERFLPALLEGFGLPPGMLATATDAIAKQAAAATPQNVVDIGAEYPATAKEG